MVGNYLTLHQNLNFGIKEVVNRYKFVKKNNLNLSETNKEDNILTDRNKEDTKVHKQKLKNAMSLLKVKKVDGSIDDITF